MRLELFSLIDATIDLLNLQNPSYQYVEKKVKEVFHALMNKTELEYIDIDSRIKQEASLKEKIIRNKYYLDCHSPEEVLLALPDLVGLTIECRFISEENLIYRTILDYFVECENSFSQCILDENLYLDCYAPQPQRQRNGFIIYRMDGYYLFNGTRINFELQIKSLVHRFWSDIEHQVVYKNTSFLYNDSFIKEVLSSIHDSLEVVDHQLEIISTQIKAGQNDTADFGVSERSFKLFLSKAINDLYNLKMTNSLGFTTDFKKCSAILSQYIYIHDFMRSEEPGVRMIEYLEHFNLLKILDMDFSMPIYLEQDFQNPDPFCDILGKYWQNIINIDYEWHVFFYMLFILEPGNNIQDFTCFISVIKGLLVNRIWYEERFRMLKVIEAQQLKDALLKEIANAMVKVGKVEIVHEDRLLSIMELFKSFVKELEEKIEEDPNVLNNIDPILKQLNNSIVALF